MKIGDQVDNGIHAGSVNGHRIICSPIEYDLPFKVNWCQATEYCRSIGMELPTKEELNLLCELYKTFPKYFPKRKYQWYWSSTESSTTRAWSQDFNSGIQSTFTEAGRSYVRPIKRIKI